MSEELIASKCCPTFYKATRVDSSCFRRAEAYISTDTFTGIAVDRKFVRFGTDNTGDDLVWEVDKSTEITSVPAGFTTITGLTAATDILTTADAIMLESSTQDDKIYMIIAACRRADYDVILKGGSGADYLVNDATKLAAFQKRFGSFATAVSGNCIKPKQQFFAVNVRSATINTSTSHQNDHDAGTPGNATPIAIGKFIKLTGNLTNAAGSAASVFRDTIGNNDEESATTASSVTNEIFKVIDVKKQTIPGVAAANGSTIYPYDVDAYIESATITTLNTSCSDCLQAYLDYESQGGATTATLDTIIPFGSAGDTYIDLLNKAPTLWPCRVQINRKFNLSMGDTNLATGDKQRILSRQEGDIEFITDTTIEGSNCADPSNNPNNSQTINSFQFGYDTSNTGKQPFQGDIFNAHRGKQGGVLPDITINTEYTKNLRMISTAAESDGACGDHVAVRKLSPSSGSDVSFDYLLNSVSITTSYSTDSTVGDVPTLAVFPTTENASLAVDIVPAWRDGQSRQCGLNKGCPPPGGLGAGFQTVGYSISDRPVVAGKLETTTPSIGLDSTATVYHGRIGMTTPRKELIPMLRYAKFYCNASPSAENGVNSMLAGTRTEAIQRILFEDKAVLGDIDLVVPLTPQVEIAAGFNVNGFKPSEQRTSTTNGRTDTVVDPADGSLKCFPGKSHQAKFTFGNKSATGTSITGIPFYFTSYAVGDADTYKYSEQPPETASSLAGFGLQDIINFEDEKNCNGAVAVPLGTTGRDLDTLDTSGVHFCSDGGICNSVNVSGCRDIHILTNPSFLGFFIGNNKYTKFNGTTDTSGGFLTDAFLYAGNGTNYTTGHLSGDAYEFVKDNGQKGTRTNDSRVGVDSEWSSVIIEAQDPFARGCTDCLRTYEDISGGDNYTLMTHPYENTASSLSNPHTI